MDFRDMALIQFSNGDILGLKCSLLSEGSRYLSFLLSFFLLGGEEMGAQRERQREKSKQALCPQHGSIRGLIPQP